jgi:hypothetical protein
MDVQLGSLHDKLSRSICCSYQITRMQYNEHFSLRIILGVALITSNPINKPSCVLFYSGLRAFLVSVQTAIAGLLKK